MVAEPRSSKTRSRQATPWLLRSLAALVALVLTASSLGQIAHFLLVPHAICAEHGELLELHDDDAVAAAPAHEARKPGDARPTQVSNPDAIESHDHCQLLARSQRELALPVVPSCEPAPAPSLRVAANQAVAVAALGQQAPLSLAPKTSPPVTALG